VPASPIATQAPIGDQLRRGLVDHPLVAEVTGRGLLVGVVLRQPLAAEAQKAAMAAGLILNNATPDRLRLAPPLVLSESDAAHAVTTLRAVLDEVSA
jgi:acetylornithine/N-succinyldiaminopimelate aminotransferase